MVPFKIWNFNFFLEHLYNWGVFWARLHGQKLSPGYLVPRVNFYTAFKWRKVVSASRVTFVSPLARGTLNPAIVLKRSHGFVLGSLHGEPKCLHEKTLSHHLRSPYLAKWVITTLPPRGSRGKCENCHINARGQAEIKWMQSWLNSVWGLTRSRVTLLPATIFIHVYAPP